MQTWYKSCEALIGQKKPGRKPDSKEAFLLPGERVEGTGKKNASDKKNREVGRNSRAVRQVRAMLCYHPMGVLSRTWDIWGQTCDIFRSFLLSVWTAAHSSVSSVIPYPVLALLQCKKCSQLASAHLGYSCQQTDICPLGIVFSIPNFLHTAKSLAHPSGYQILQSCSSPVKYLFFWAVKSSSSDLGCSVSEGPQDRKIRFTNVCQCIF